MSRFKLFLLRAVEVFLFCLAFALTIPPYMSIPGQVSRLTPSLVAGTSALAVSLFLSFRRGAENLATGLLKLLFYMAFAWLVHERVFH